MCRSQNLEGHGLIQSHSGDGFHGGAGGHVAMFLQEEIYFFGSFGALGAAVLDST
jgi:hypothetical protein